MSFQVANQKSTKCVPVVDEEMLQFKKETHTYRPGVQSFETVVSRLNNLMEEGLVW